MKRILWRIALILTVLSLTAGVCYAISPKKKPEKKVEQKQNKRSSGSKPAKKVEQKQNKPSSGSKPTPQSQESKESSYQSNNSSSNQGNQSGGKTSHTTNVHEWVDLGLPSGLKWATCNVGATTPEGRGDYFAWGETTVKSRYSSDNSATFDKEFSWLRSNGYIDSYGNLTMAHDAARQNWGGTWRMPTLAEIKELREYTTTEWTTRNGMEGRLVKSEVNGATIFLPASGWYGNDECNDFGGGGYYWSSTAGSEDSGCAGFLYFGSGYFDWGNYGYRCYGLTVRPVTE